MDKTKLFLDNKYVGKMKNPTIILETKSNICEDTIRLFLKIENGIIINIKYQNFGCFDFMVSCRIVSEYIENKRIVDVLNMEDEEFNNIFGDYHSSKKDCYFLIVRLLRTIKKEGL